MAGWFAPTALTQARSPPGYSLYPRPLVPSHMAAPGDAATIPARLFFFIPNICFVKPGKFFKFIYIDE